MRVLTSLLLLTLMLPPVFPQNRILTLEDCIGMNREVLPKGIANLQWIPGGNSYSYIKNDTLFSGTVRLTKDAIVVTSTGLSESIKSESHLLGEKFPGLSQVTWVDNESFLFNIGSNLCSYSTQTNDVKYINSIPDGENIDKSNEKNYFAFTKGNDLRIMKEGKEIVVATSEKEGIIYGTERAHRNEFGITKGTFWSGHDNYLAFYRMDESMVTDYPLIDITGRIATVQNTKYPMAGMASHEVTLGIYDLKSSKTVYIKTGEPADQYLTLVTWDPSEKYIYVGILNRGQNHLKFNKYDVTTGDLVKTLFEESDKEYVEPQFNPLFIFDDPSVFLWQSRKDGWNHLYQYNTEGTLLKRITEGEWEVTGVIGLDKKNKRLLFTATKESPIENNIYSIGLGTGEIFRLSSDHGVHKAIFSGSTEYLIDNYSSTKVINRYDIVDANGKVVKTLFNAEDPLKNYLLGKVTIGTLENENGEELYYRMVTPPGFDSSQKYPVFFYVYGGPHLQMVTDESYGGAGLWDFRWAQRGYIVFSLDNRGTPNRGADFEQVIHRNLGTAELEDQMVGVNYLRSLPYVDNTRMAVDGWSYGGFMTTSLMLKRPGTFQVGVAGGPVIDWQLYEVMYGERYMDTPLENPDGYSRASLLNYVESLEGNLLMIHSVTDPVVVIQNSLSFIDKCIKSGVQVDYFVYPGHDHNVLGRDRIHLYKKIEDYIDAVVLEPVIR